MLGFRSRLQYLARCNDTIRWSCVFVLRRYGYCRFRLEAENCLARKPFAIRCENSVSHSWCYRNSSLVIRSKRLHETTRLENDLCATANTHTHTPAQVRNMTRHMCALTCFPNGFYAKRENVSFVLFVLGIRLVWAHDKRFRFWACIKIAIHIK